MIDLSFSHNQDKVVKCMNENHMVIGYYKCMIRLCD